MIKFITGDILKSDAYALVNTVNCEGYMGKGIAYQFKLAFPNNNKDYITACKDGSLTTGKLHYYTENDKLIVNFPTKNKWREKSDITYITSGLKELKKLIYELKIGSIAIPPLGCGNGGLNWDVVKKVILEQLGPCEEDLDIYIYEPSQYFKTVSTTAPKLNTSHLIIMSFKPFLKAFTKLTLQKGAFFMTVFAGEEYFKFKKHKYGPYSHSIDIIIKNIKEFQDFYNIDTIKAFEMAKKTLVSKNVQNKLEHLLPYIKQSIEFINSFPSSKEIELISTICFIIKEKGLVSTEEIIKEINEWSEEKATKFSDQKDIDKAIDVLINKQIICKDLLGHFLLCNQIKSIKAQ